MSLVHMVEDDESRPVPAIFPGAASKVLIGAASAQSGAFGSSTGLIRIACSVGCFIAIGANPVADSNSLFLPAGMVEYFGVSPGQKIAVIQNTEAGFLSVVEAL